MLVRLGSTTAPHRAHILRGLLQSHGIPAFVWHEQAAHLYVPGTEIACSVMVDDGDESDVREILAAPPEEMPVGEVAGEGAPQAVFPGLGTLWMAGTGMSMAIASASALFYSIARLKTVVHPMAAPEPPLNIPWGFLGSPAIGLAWALLVGFFLAPMRGLYREKWMGLVGYVHVRFGFPAAIIFVSFVLHFFRRSS